MPRLGTLQETTTNVGSASSSTHFAGSPGGGRAFPCNVTIVGIKQRREGLGFLLGKYQGLGYWACAQVRPAFLR